MVEPIKPIEGMVRDGEGQASVMAEVVRDNYWKQRSQETPTVEQGDASGKAGKKQADTAKKESPIKTRHTYAEFEINRETREVIVRIIDADTGSLVRTIPPDELAKEIANGNFQPNQLRRRAVFI